MTNLSVPQESHAQDKKSRYEKIQERKNKANRKLKRRGDKSRKARKSFTKFKQKSKQGDRAYKGDIAGRKVKSKISPSRRSKAVHPQPNPYAGRSRQSEASRAKAFNRTIRYSQKPRERAWKGNISGNKLQNKGFRSEKRRLVPQTSPYLKRNRSGERDGARFSGQGFKGIRSVSGRSRNALKSTRIVPRSASGAYRVRKKERPYAIRERSKWESAFKGDITGRKFQTKRTTDRPGVKKPPVINSSFKGKGRRGDRAYKGQITGGYKSVSSYKEKAWNKDISGNKLRVRTSQQPKFNDAHFKVYPKGKRKGDEAYKGKLSGGGYKTAGRKIERTNKSLPQKPPGAGSERAVRFQGNIKAQKPLKGGGSVSGRWNNNGKAIQGRGLKDQDQRTTRFQGNLKASKPLKGGGSVSGKRWNNKGNPIQGRGLKDQDQRTARFQGNIKAGKPLKGGGSVSGSWNNKGNPIQGRGLKDQDQRTARFQGNIKAGKPLKGGGSISGKSWNNKGNPIQGRGFNDQDQRTAKFQGNIKSSKPLKGGGSIARNQWNNKGKPIQGRGYRDQDERAAKFQGNIKGGKPLKGGGSVSRNRWNNDGEALTQKPQSPQIYWATQFKGRFKRKSKSEITEQDKKIAGFSGNIKKWKYNTGPLPEHQYTGRFKRNYKPVQNPNSARGALKGKGMGNVDKKMADFTGNIKQWKYKTGPLDEMKYEGRFKLNAKYKRNPNASKEALLSKVSKSSTDQKAAKFQGRFKMTASYKKKPNAADGAMRGIGPSKAAISASNYQGNLKMKKGRFGDKHPSFKFDDKPNGTVEKTKFSFKLLWSKLFKKSENQPKFLKEKPRRPRYDKGEEGLWNE